MNKEDEFRGLVSKLLRDKNKEAFLSGLEKWFMSIYNELKDMGKTDEQIGKEVGELCYNLGKTFINPNGENRTVLTPENEYLRDVLVSGLMQFIMGQRIKENLYTIKRGQVKI